MRIAVPTEAQEQEAIFAWAEIRAKRIHELALM